MRIKSVVIEVEDVNSNIEETLPKKEEISIKPERKKTLLELIEEEENKIEE